MKILMFDYEYPPLGGGGGVVNAFVAEELAKRHSVWVVTSQYGNLPAREEKAGVNIVRTRVWGRRDRSAASMRSMLTYPPSAWVAGARLLRELEFDLINAHFAVPTGPGSLPLARMAGIPHVLSLHGGDIYNPAYRFSPHRLPLIRGTVTSVLRRSDVVVAQSSNTRENAYKYYRYEGPIEVIPLGIPVPDVPAAGREELDLPHDAFLAVTIGRLVERKATDRLIKALAREELTGVTLIVIGDGPDREELERLAASLGISDRVLFRGRVSDEEKWQLLRNSDLYASASLHEGFGLVFLEAMACGLPVVCPDHGGQVDFLSDGDSGHLVPVGDENALVDAIGRLARSPELARQLGTHNLEASLGFTSEKCAARYESLFDRVLGGWRPSSDGG